MVVLSSKVRYGTAALLELAGNYGGTLLQSKVIAERRGIPPNYLEQLLNQLTKAGIVRAVRGNKGGYELAEDPAKIRFLQILEILEGGGEVTASGSPDALEALYRQAEGEIKTTFSLSLAELMIRQKKYDEGMMFHI
jgi:Rrf2 family protein